MILGPGNGMSAGTSARSVGRKYRKEQILNDDQVCKVA